MNVKWLVERSVFEEDIDPLIAEIKRQGMTVEQIKYLPFQSGSYDNFGPDDCVMCYASLNLVQQLQRQKPWVPGSFCTLPNFECSKYYAHYGDYLINRQYVMMPLAELKRRKKELFHQFDPRPGVKQMFVRPSSGFKTFTGQVVHTSTFDKDYEWFEEFAGSEALVVVAAVQRITGEWRFIVAERKIIAACRYKPSVESTCRGIGPFDLVELIAKEEWQPDPIYVVDIGKIESGFGLLEINSFSCSGFYACDVEPIIREASRLALQDWKEING